MASRSKIVVKVLQKPKHIQPEDPPVYQSIKGNGSSYAYEHENLSKKKDICNRGPDEPSYMASLVRRPEMRPSDPQTQCRATRRPAEHEDSNAYD